MPIFSWKLDHISDTGSHSDFRYWIKLEGTSRLGKNLLPDLWKLGRITSFNADLYFVPKQLESTCYGMTLHGMKHMPCTQKYPAKQVYVPNRSKLGLVVVWHKYWWLNVWALIIDPIEKEGNGIFSHWWRDHPSNQDTCSQKRVDKVSKHSVPRNRA